MRMEPALRQGVQRAKDEIEARYWGDPNIVGLGVALRRREGRLTDEVVVRVMVEKKRPAAYVSRHRLLPATVTVDGQKFGVDVVETGRFESAGGRSAAAAPPLARTTIPGVSITERYRPPVQGCSVSNVNIPGPGTLGAIVTDWEDGTACLLSAGHVLAGPRNARPGELIVQPAEHLPHDTGNRIATLKRYLPLTTGDGNIDAAIAQLDPGITATDAVAKGLMAPITDDHRVLGLLFASNKATGSCLIAPINPIINALHIDFYNGDVAQDYNDLALGTPIEKVGRTTAYSSSRYEGFAAGPIRVTYDLPNGTTTTFVFRNVLLSTGLGYYGDSGAAVCVGGNGQASLPPEDEFNQYCRFLDTAGEYYDIPLANDHDLADRFRDEFLLQCRTGRMLVQIFYVNFEVGISRLDGQSGFPDEQAYAQTYYDMYRNFIADVLANPSPDARITEDHLADMSFIIWGLGQTVLTRPEFEALGLVYDEVLAGTVGMNRDELIAYLNTDRVFDTVRGALASVPTIEMAVPQ